MNAAALAAITSMIQQVTTTALALQQVALLIRKRQDAGQDVTLDDLKGLQLDNADARAVLVQAIEDAEDV